MQTTSDIIKNDTPLLSRRVLVAIGLASMAAAAASRPLTAHAAISDLVMDIAADQEVAEADQDAADVDHVAPTAHAARTLPDSVWLWTTRSFRYEDGIPRTTMQRSYDERGNILEHRMQSIWDGEEMSYTTVYDYEDGLPVYRGGLSPDGSRPETSVFHATFDDEGFPVTVTWDEDDVSTTEFHATGYVASDIEMDSTGDVPLPVSSFYDENGYPVAFSIGFDETYREATWDFDERGYARSLTVRDTNSVYIDADALVAIEAELDSLDFADLANRFALENEGLFGNGAIKGHAFELVRLSNGGALAYDADGWWPVGTFTCETDEAGNIVAVYDEQGALIYEATFELFENPTAWAMCMSGYRFLLGIL